MKGKRRREPDLAQLRSLSLSDTADAVADSEFRTESHFSLPTQPPRIIPRVPRTHNGCNDHDHE